MEYLLKNSFRGLLVALFLISPSVYASTYFEVLHYGTLTTGATSESAVQQWCDIKPLCTSFALQGIYTYSHGYNVTYNGGNLYITASIKNGTCPSPLVDDGNGVCVEDVKDCTDDEGLILSSGYYKNSDIYTNSNIISPRFFCTDECLVQTSCDPTVDIVIENGIEVTYSSCDMVQTAFDCQQGDADAPLHVVAPPEDTCESGHTYGTVDGRKVCIKPDGTLANTAAPNIIQSETVSDTTTVDNGDGTSTVTTTDTTTNSDGTTSQNITTNIVDNSTGAVNTSTRTELASTPATSGEEQQGSECGGTGQPACDVTLSGSESLTDPNTVLTGSGITEQIDSYIVEIEAIGNDNISDNILSNPFSLPSSGFCNPASYGVDFHGTGMNFMSKFCEAYDAVLHPGLRFFFYGLTIIALYRIYLTTAVRSL